MGKVVISYGSFSMSFEAEEEMKDLYEMARQALKDYLILLSKEHHSAEEGEQSESKQTDDVRGPVGMYS